MDPLFRWIVARHLGREVGTTLPAVLGVALGVAVFVAIRLANHSAMASFRATVDAVAGTANLQLAAGAEGLPERLFPEVRRVPGVLAAAPVVQSVAPVADGRGEALLVLGIDPFSERAFDRYGLSAGDARGPAAEEGRAFLSDPRAAAVTQSLARRLGLREGSSLPLLAGTRRVPLTVRVVLRSERLEQAMGGNLVLVDIATAQEIFDRYGRLDRIDLQVREAERQAVSTRLAPLLPPGAQIGRPEGRTRQVEEMIRAFQLNLTAMSCIALLVAAFLILNSVSMSVVRRRREIGVLRALGVTRGQVLRMFMAEAAVCGVLGGALGVALGVGLAHASLSAVSQTISALYVVVKARTVDLSPAILAQGAGLGVGAALLAALIPAREAAGTAPSATIQQGVVMEPQALPIRAWSLLGVGALVLSAATGWFTLRLEQPLLGFGSGVFLLAGFALLTPLAVLVADRLLTPTVSAIFRVEGLLAARYLVESLARTGAVIAALMVAVAMWIGLSLMVGSFRDTVDTWVTQTVRADLYVEPAGRTMRGTSAALPTEVVEAARGLPEVAAVDTYRGVTANHGGRRVSLVGLDLSVLERHGRILFRDGRSPEILARTRAGRGVVVTESFARRFGARPGERIRLETPSGPREVPVFGVFYDYSTDAGAIVMDRGLYAEWWGDPTINSIALYLKPGAEPDAARHTLLAALKGRHALLMTSNQSLRRQVLHVFDQTFRITYALQAIVVIVAVLGILNTLTALMLQRGREIAVLRAVGAWRRQIRRLVMVEAGLIGVMAHAIGSLCGVALALMLVHVINRQFFGWSIQFRLDPVLFLHSGVIILAAALLAGLLPARHAARRVAAEAMRGE
jgi:putative ABC transport system permease protein